VDCFKHLTGKTAENYDKCHAGFPVLPSRFEPITDLYVESSLLGLAPSALDECKAGSSYPCRFCTQILAAPPVTVRCTDEVDLDTNLKSLLLELITLARNVGAVLSVSRAICRRSVGRKLQVNTHRPTVTYLIIRFVQCAIFLFNLLFIFLFCFTPHS
jgi:hypothetical protein